MEQPIQCEFVYFDRWHCKGYLVDDNLYWDSEVVIGGSQYPAQMVSSEGCGKRIGDRYMTFKLRDSLSNVSQLLLLGKGSDDTVGVSDFKIVRVVEKTIDGMPVLESVEKQLLSEFINHSAWRS